MKYTNFTRTKQHFSAILDFVTKIAQNSLLITHYTLCYIRTKSFYFDIHSGSHTQACVRCCESSREAGGRAN